jgi:hypothetical protein
MTNQQDNELPLQIADSVLDAKHFTASGKRQFTLTVADYVRQLLAKSIHFGEIDKADGLNAEITHDHVKASAHAIASSYSKPTIPMWVIVVQVLEYVATAAAGVGGGHLDKPWGIGTFGVGVSIAVILVVIRLTQSKSA